MTKTQRIDKVLANLGYGTRKDVKSIIKNGEVSIDGIVVCDSGTHVDPKSQCISVNGEKINYKEFVYIMMNKPAGVISATEDAMDKTVIDILTPEYRVFNLSPVGRLDKDTVGLMLLTNDGDLTHRIISPKNHVSKVYYARINGVVTSEDIQRFKEGVTLDDGYKTMPANLKIIESNEVSTIELEIFEGKFHQVKRMFESIGKKVIYLMRLSIGPIRLDPSLPPGSFRELTHDELSLIK